MLDVQMDIIKVPAVIAKELATVRVCQDVQTAIIVVQMAIASKSLLEMPSPRMTPIREDQPVKLMTKMTEIVFL